MFPFIVREIKMDLWKYYDGDLKYPDLSKHSHIKEVAKVTPKWAFEYAKEHGINKELEPIIAKSAYYSYLYAQDILNGKRFKLGEPTIAKDVDQSFEYALWILKKAFPEAEPTIAKYAFTSREYTQLVLKRDFYLDGKLICEYDEDEDY